MAMIEGYPTVHKSIKLNRRAKNALEDWLLRDTVEKITMGDIKVEEDQVTVPVTICRPCSKVEGKLVFESQDIAAEILGHYAHECGDDELFEFAKSLTKNEASINYLNGLKENEQ